MTISNIKSSKERSYTLGSRLLIYLASLTSLFPKTSGNKKRLLKTLYLIIYTGRLIFLQRDRYKVINKTNCLSIVFKK
jgi:hypothetical protein